MKRVTLLCGLLLAASATVASAAGVNIRWSDCFNGGTAGATGTLNRSFACNTNAQTGAQAITQTMYGSFQLDADLANVSGNEQVVDIASSSATLPDWWAFKNAGTCRSISLSWGLANAGLDCIDWASGQASGGIGAYSIGARGPNTARVVVASAVADPVLVPGGQELYCFGASINNAKTIGVGACGGCQTPVCIVFNSILLATPIAANNVKISGPTNGTDSNFATWQGGGSPVVGGQTGCGAATPTRNTTWGAVKALYH